MVKVSVVIPVYNAEKYLRQSLDSISSQTLKDIEIICVDDGSSDSSPELLTAYAEVDTRFRIISQPNSGPGIARNTGMRAAVGKYIIFLDSDDWFEPDFLENMYEMVERHGSDIGICKAEQFDSASGQALPSEWMLKTHYLPGEAFSSDELSEHLFQFTYGQVWDKMYRRSFLEAHGLCFPDLRAAEDTAFVYQGLLLASNISVLPEVKVHYRVNVSGSVSNSFVTHPHAPFAAFELVYYFLKERDLYEKYERSFLNWAMEYLVWQVCNMPDDSIRRKYFLLLNERWIPELGLSDRDADYYQDKKSHIKFRLVEKLPYPVFSLLLAVYKSALRGRK